MVAVCHTALAAGRSDSTFKFFLTPPSCLTLFAEVLRICYNARESGTT